MEEHKKTSVIKKRQIQLRDGQIVSLRPLASDDKIDIKNFYSKLSSSTRRLYVLDNYGDKAAIGLCKSLTNPEKLHFVVQNSLS